MLQNTKWFFATTCRSFCKWKIVFIQDKTCTIQKNCYLFTIIIS